MLQRDVGKITLHKNFTGNGDFDVAILRMVNAIPSGAIGIAPIPLRSQSLTAGTSCVVSGWGEFSLVEPMFSDPLITVPVAVLPSSDCSAVWGGTLPTGMVCVGAEQKRVCTGDLGAPVVCNRQLAGFVSRDTTCQVRHTLVTSVPAYKSWIDANSSWHVKANYLLIAVGLITQSIRLVSA